LCNARHRPHNKRWNNSENVKFKESCSCLVHSLPRFFSLILFSELKQSGHKNPLLQRAVIVQKPLVLCVISTAKSRDNFQSEKFKLKSKAEILSEKHITATVTDNKHKSNWKQFLGS
jgi:hypothetical protein